MIVPVNEPLIVPRARKLVLDCLKTGWISSAGSYIGEFEHKFASYIGTRYAATTTSGTSALHLALASLGIGKGDEVIIPDLTIISCALAVIYTGAVPVVVDVEPSTGTIDPKKIEEKITKQTRAIMVVHLYGHPANLDPIIDLSRKYRLFLVEDAAEAHGAEYKGKKVGGIGDVGAFSFYGNKIVTTGEGGMVVTNQKSIYEKAILLKDLAHSKRQRFLHEEIGFNYRMTNIQAALGLAQLEKIERFIAKKRWMAGRYAKAWKNEPLLEVPTEAPWAKSVYWMYAVRLKKKAPLSRDTLRMRLKELGVDTRDFFLPLHRQPCLRKLGLCRNVHCPQTVDLSKRGFYVPSGLAITPAQIGFVLSAMEKSLYETA